MDKQDRTMVYVRSQEEADTIRCVLLERRERILAGKGKAYRNSSDNVLENFSLVNVLLEGVPDSPMKTLLTYKFKGLLAFLSWLKGNDDPEGPHSRLEDDMNYDELAYTMLPTDFEMYKKLKYEDPIPIDAFVAQHTRPFQLVYVAGALSAGNEKGVRDNIGKAMSVSLDLFLCGFHPYVPHLTWYLNEFYRKVGTDVEEYDFWLRHDAGIIERCDAILFLPDWENSHGACFEHALATEIGIPIYYDITEIPMSLGMDNA